MLNLAFIGGGSNSAVGYAHFVASQLDGNARLVAGCFSGDSEENAQSAIAYKVDANRTYGTWSELLDRERGLVDAIVVLTPIPTHKQIVIAALEMGYVVICEKALATSSQDCAEVARLVSQCESFLAVTYNYSGYPMIRELKSMVNNGDLGTIQQVHVEMPQESFARVGANPQDWRKADYEVPTVSLDLGSHVYHLVDFVLGGPKPISLVSNQMSYGPFNEVVDNVFCLAKYQEEISVMAWWGKTTLGYRNGLRLRVFGSEGSAEWYQMEPENIRMAGKDGQIRIVDRSSPDIKIANLRRYERFKAGHPAGFVEAFANLYLDIFRGVSALTEVDVGDDSLNSGYICGAKEAQENLLFLEKIHESSRLEEWVSVGNVI